MTSKDKAPADNVVEAEKPKYNVQTWKEKMNAVVQQAAASEAPKGGFLSFKGGNMTYDDNLIPGNTLDVVVIDFLLENAIFREKYNPAKTASPMCYALGRLEETLVPVEDCEDPQAPACGISGQEGCCPHNEWGSDPEGGRGKACKNSRRIAIMAADVLPKGPEEIKKANVIMCKLPVTSIKNFSQFVNQCTKVLETAPFGVKVRMSVKPHPTSLFQVHWTILDKIVGDDVMEALYNKHVSIQKQMFQPYPANDEAEPAPAAKGGKSKF
jgi:hypothetical protein